MKSGEFHILPTDHTPEFLFSDKGTIKIKGRGLYGTKSEVSDQIMDWLDSYLKNPADVTYVIIAFEYLNSFSTTIITSVLSKLSKVILQKKKLTIQWYFEEDDDDILERGECVSSTFNIPITFIPTTDIDEC